MSAPQTDPSRMSFLRSHPNLSEAKVALRARMHADENHACPYRCTIPTELAALRDFSHNHRTLQQSLCFEADGIVSASDDHVIVQDDSHTISESA